MFHIDVPGVSLISPFETAVETIDTLFLLQMSYVIASIQITVLAFHDKASTLKMQLI